MRKSFILLATIVLTGLAVTMNQARGQSDRIAILGPPEEPRFSEMKDGLKRGLGDLGYSDVEILEARVPRGSQKAVRTAVAKFTEQRVTVLFAIGSKMAKLARKVSSDLPIVYITPGDPVKHGLVASLSHPGGNTTAMTFEHPELAGKRLEILKQLLPQARRVLILYDPRDGSPRRGAKAARQAASNLGLTLVERETRLREDIQRGLEDLGKADAFLSVPGGLPTGFYEEIIRAANAQKVPTIFHASTGSTKEALVSYGTSDADIARQAARHVSKILKGTRAGDLPVERPTKLDLVINLRTAKQLGITIPSSMRYRADKVIR